MSYKHELTKVLEQKIKRARSYLEIGWHNPDLMEQIDSLFDVMRQVRDFEQSLLLDNSDID